LGEIYELTFGHTARRKRESFPLAHSAGKNQFQDFVKTKIGCASLCTKKVLQLLPLWP